MKNEILLKRNEDERWVIVQLCSWLRINENEELFIWDNARYGLLFYHGRCFVCEEGEEGKIDN